MKNIAEIDKNLAVKEADEHGFVWYDCLTPPFKVCGLIPTEDGFLRMPRKVAENTSEGVAALVGNTSGGRVRFVTDSPEISIRAKMYDICRASHFALTGAAGFDLYADNNYFGTFIPPYEIEDGFSSTVRSDGKPHDMVINFPLYSEVKKLEIGVKSGSRLEPAGDYKIEPPIVFYGSSITQGGCASRPGNCYQAVVSRMLDCDYVNLGFSGWGRGEDAIAEYIAGLSMSAFVYDYDYNAPNSAYLLKTHEKMFRTVREKNPSLPIIMMSRPDPRVNEDGRRMRRIIMKNFCDACDAGDKNLYFLDGRSFVREGDGTVDGTHPNDLGFRYMADAVGNLLKTIFN